MCVVIPKRKHYSILVLGVGIDLVTRTKALTMDEQRKEHVAYEYLCHLEEAKK